jgi:hypothetical protein
MRRKVIIARLKRLQTEADAIRRKLRISAPNAVLYLESLDPCGDRQVVVEADGFGGATTSTVEGNCPLDYLTHHAKEFRSEEAAIHAAAEIVEQQVEPANILA